ncbi:MAG: DUF2232 domain-containing protein [Mycobacteriaceae bacterium]
MTSASPTVRGPLRPEELATAAVMAGLTVAMVVIAVIIPIAGVLGLLAAVPMGIVAQRHRPRAVLAATVAATIVAFVVAGTAALSGLWMAALVGAMIGDVKRRGRGWPTLVVYLIAVAPLILVVIDGLLLLFANTRILLLEAVTNTVHGLSELLRGFSALASLADEIDSTTTTLVQYWWLTIPVLVFDAIIGGTWVAWIFLGPVLQRLDRATVAFQLTGLDVAARVAPVPVTLSGAGFCYPQARTDALSGVDLTVELGDYVAVVGDNGSGKSTLLQLLAGRTPSTGTLARAGSVGLGQRGGTALVLQRPESQVLGVRVADDVVWGLPVGTAVDVEALLDTVGLSMMGQRETSTLSGGELQRLAVAAALARKPALLLSDESTAMVDSEGRAALVQLFARLAAPATMAVVHVTHRESETAWADRVLHLQDGRVQTQPHRWPAGVIEPAPPCPPAAAALLEVIDVSHAYAPNTPWEQPALHGVSLTVRQGEGLLVAGGNGSGKSTLAWILAGLLKPQHGQCLLDGRAVATQVGAVALAFQHARLQVLRETVGAEIASAAGMFEHPDWAAVGRALSTVGLDPALSARPVEQLSGGQLRRVALAGLLARKPKVLVLDEPLAGLDAGSRYTLAALLAGLLRDTDLTLVVISHDLDEMEMVCSRSVVLDGGRLTVDGVPSAPGAIPPGGRT